MGVWPPSLGLVLDWICSFQRSWKSCCGDLKDFGLKADGYLFYREMQSRITKCNLVPGDATRLGAFTFGDQAIKSPRAGIRTHI
jgi:hypothetical protein